MKIDLENYEEFMVSYIDGELNAVEKELFISFLKKHPHLQEELDDFSELKFTASDSIVFEDKKVLFKKVGAFVLLKRALPYAALLLLVFSIFIFSNRDKEEEYFVQHKEPVELPGPSEEVIEDVGQEPAISEDQMQIPVPQIRTQSVLPQARFIKKSTITKKAIAKKERPLYKEQEKKGPIVEQELEEVFLVKEKKKLSVELPVQLTELEQEKKLVQTEKNKESIQLVKPQAGLEKQSKGLLLVIDESSHPIIHSKLNKVVTKVENKIKTIKELKEEPITVSIGKLKLFTLNTANAAQAN